ncbi:PH domain-containing protein [Amycolatopsis suaedae]|uniref:PH domain-containing protein n=2 Tax=Amycolatopsis suaedae TaxID=2510978 RepID=A0A4Q7J7N2_9PSEU|nr:PH domain-containing protein [Amycolatopsis suaedae]
MLVLPIVILLVVIAGGVWLAVLAKDSTPPWDMIWLIAIAAVAVLLIVWLFLAPFVRWRTTHFIVTTDRVIAREGVVKRTGIDIPMGRINSVQFEHGLTDRIFGCGTLIIESASDEPLKFDDIPQVEKVHTYIYRQVNDNPYDDYPPDTTQPADPGPQQQPRGRRGR